MKRIVLLLVTIIILLSSCADSETSSLTGSGDISDSMSSKGEGPSDETITVVYKATEGGYVSGGANQTLKKGEKTQSVTAMANLCYSFEKWSDGVETPTRSGDSFLEDSTITAIFEYSGLPELHINYTADRVHKSYPITASFQVKNADMYEFENALGTIQGRGNSTWDHEKKPYKIKFNKAINLLGIGDDAKRDWVLLSNHCDQSLFRNYFGYNLAYKLGIGYKSTLVEVYLNGSYNGVYMLTGKVEESRHDVDTDKGGFLIELDDYYEGEEYVDYISVGIEYYTFHSELTVEQMEEVYFCIEAIDSAMEAEDEERIKELVDIDSFVNMYLLQEYTKNIDVGWSSFYMYKTDGNDKLHMGPVWDLDIAMGNDVRLDNGGYDYIYVGRTSGMTQQHMWFIALCGMEWFRDLAVERWNEYFKDAVNETLSELKEYANINFAELEYNFVRWDNVFGKRINCEPEHIMALDSYEKHYDFFIAWMENRLTWLDECFNDKEMFIRQTELRLNPRTTKGKLPQI